MGVECGGSFAGAPSRYCRLAVWSHWPCHAGLRATGVEGIWPFDSCSGRVGDGLTALVATASAVSHGWRAQLAIRPSQRCSRAPCCRLGLVDRCCASARFQLPGGRAFAFSRSRLAPRGRGTPRTVPARRQPLRGRVRDRRTPLDPGAPLRAEIGIRRPTPDGYDEAPAWSAGSSGDDALFSGRG